jgi:hypothetical protein
MLLQTSTLSSIRSDDDSCVRVSIRAERNALASPFCEIRVAVILPVWLAPLIYRSVLR